MNLKDLVVLEENNDACVILKVKQNAFLDLIKLGCFSGDEKIIRLTKGRDHTCTIWTNERSYSWHWGYGGYTLVSDEMTKKGRMISDTITKDFGIYIE